MNSFTPVSRLRLAKHRFFLQKHLVSLRWHRLRSNPTAPYIKRIATDSLDYLSRNKSRTHETITIVDPPQPFYYPPLKTLESTPHTHSLYNPVPRTFVARLDDVRVLGSIGQVLTSDGTLLTDITYETPTAPYKDRVWTELGTLHDRDDHLSDTACLLASHYGGFNYFHYLLESLPRVDLVRRAGIDFDAIDHFLVNPFEFESLRGGLESVGVPLNRIVPIDAQTVYHVDHLIAPSTLRATGHMRKSVVAWLRENFAPSTPAPDAPARLYLGRDDASSRHITNQSEIQERVLSPLGFECLSWGQRSIQAQAALFSNADVVVGPSGAAMSNLVFCKPGTRVLLFHPHTYIARYFYELCAVCELEYYYLIGEPMPGAKPGDNGSNYAVSLDKVARLLKFAGVT